jgi:hypothetical protein
MPSVTRKIEGGNALYIKHKGEGKMKIKITPILTQGERAMWVDLVSKLQNVCNSMKCPYNVDCAACPFDKLTDHAHDLADEILDKLRECKIEGEGE